MKKNIIVKILPLFYIFCFICIVISIVSVYNINQEEKNRLLTIGNELNIDNTGETIDLELNDSNLNEEVTYEVKDENIVKVENDGTLVTVGEGSTEVIVTNKDNTKKQIIKVNVGQKAITESSSTKTDTTTNKNETTSTKTDTTTSKNETTSTKTSTTTSKNETTSTKTDTTTNKNETTSTKTSTTTSKNETTSTKTDTTTSKNETTSTKTDTTINKKINVTGIKLNKSNAEISLNSSNKTISLTATISPSNASNKGVIWTSSNPNIASVNNGIITAKSPGVAIITAKTTDGGKTANIKVTVKKRVVIVIGASQVTRMVNYKKDNYNSKNYNYNVSNGTLVYINKSGTGINWQVEEGMQLAKNVINSYSTVKEYVNLYVFFPLSGNTIKNWTCSEISSSNNRLITYVKNYNNSIQNLKNSGYNVQGYVTAMHPVKYTQRTNSEIVSSKDSNACEEGYRSNYKYYKFNNAVHKILDEKYSSNLKYEPLLGKILDTSDASNRNFKFKVTYNTTDGMHWDSATTHMYVDMMLGYYGDL